MPQDRISSGKTTAYFHLPGLFEFYELYKRFLPLFFEHREYFYEWCGIGSIYGAPAGCIWGGGRVGEGDQDPGEVLALLEKYGISARLTFSNSLLREEHLADRKCNALCAMFEKSGKTKNGVIVHSELLLEYLKKKYPGLYFVSSTTKVLTDFDRFTEEVDREEFRYAVPDFRLNKALDQWDTLSERQKAKVEFPVQRMLFLWMQGQETLLRGRQPEKSRGGRSGPLLYGSRRRGRATDFPEP
ncbi:MAG: hypothetical protein ACLU8D_06890 [Enterocloster sp.]